MMNDQILIGVDFSSAPTKRKPITVAVGRLRGHRRLTYELETIRELASLAAFDAMLAESGSWLGGFDLPFGQPRSLIEHEGWPTDWATFVRFYCQQPRESLRDTFRSWCNARPVGDKFAWRKTDKPAGSSPAMRWTNPPVAWMMHAGIGRMLAAGLSFPAHRHPRRRRQFAKVALEAYPAFTAKQIVRGSYKSDTPSRQTADRRIRRQQILEAVLTGDAGLAIRLQTSAAWRRRILADGRGDLLDAVLCSLQAGHAALQQGFGLPQDLDPLEGWIASVPVG